MRDPDTGWTWQEWDLEGREDGMGYHWKLRKAMLREKRGTRERETRGTVAKEHRVQ